MGANRIYPARHQESRRLFRWLALLSLFTAGCTGPLQIERLADTPHFAQPVEIQDVPFYPQEVHQCGPAALATVLDWSGVTVTPEALVPEVYLPEREGSLQIELMASARRHVRIPYVLAPSVEDLFTEVRAGSPVLVLQNLGLDWYPVWHYAVVVGFDPEDEKVILRSGREKRRRQDMRTFELTWRRSGYWALAVLKPGEMPQTVKEREFVQAVVPLERLGHWAAVEQAYGAALRRWPQNLVAAMGLGNSRYAQGDREGAVQAFQAAIQANPDAAEAHNNLAHVLAELGHRHQALAAARRAVEIGGETRPEYRKTLTEIETRFRE